MSDSLQPHGLQYARPSCPSPTPGVYSNSCPSSQWCHPTISSSVNPFSSCPQSFPASGPFPRSRFFASGGQSIGVSSSASVLPMNIQGWFPLGLTSWISLLSETLESFLASGSFPKRGLFVSGGQSIGVLASARVLTMNIQDWFPLGWTSLISLQSKTESPIPQFKYH